MHIGLNLLHAFPGVGGVWNYMANLIKALGEYDPDNTYIAFVNDHSKNLVPDKANFICIPSRVNPRHRVSRVIYENTILDLKARQLNVACMHWFANVMAPFSMIPGVVTVHDLLVFHRPEIFSTKKRFYLKSMLRLTTKKAKVILPISKSTMLDIRHIYKRHIDEKFVLPPIIDRHFKPVGSGAVNRFKVKYSLPKKYFLYVAHTYPHKNHVGLLRAYHVLKTEGFNPWPIVFRGDPKEAEIYVQRTINELGLGEEIIRLPRIPYNELPLLYSGTDAMVYPSLFEGGGIPVIEALTCGCPVAAANIPAVKETAGNAVFLFDPYSEKSICNAMKEIQSNGDLRENLRIKGLEAAKNHDGGNIVNRLLSAYELAIS